MRVKLSTRVLDHFCVARRFESQAPLHEPPWCVSLKKIATYHDSHHHLSWSPIGFKAVICESAFIHSKKRATATARIMYGFDSCSTRMLHKQLTKPLTAETVSLFHRSFTRLANSTFVEIQIQLCRSKNQCTNTANSGIVWDKWNRDGWESFWILRASNAVWGWVILDVWLWLKQGMFSGREEPLEICKTAVQS